MADDANDGEKIQKILLELNKTGLSYLKYLQFPEAIDYFKKAEKILNEEMMISTSNAKINQLAGVTYNNLACYYKKTKKPKVALNYLKKSLELQVYKINDWVSTGSTHLNICAIYSYIGKHEQALSHVKLAVELLDKKHYEMQDNSEEAKSYWNIKMLCFYNKAIEEEHLKVYEHSLQSYKRAKQIAKIYGAKNVGIILNCDQAISRIETMLSTLKKRMINIFLKKKEDDETGHYDFMRRNIRHVSKKHIDNGGEHEEKFKRLSLYRSTEANRADRLSTGKDAVQKIERRTNSTKFKSLNDYFTQKNRTEPAQPIDKE